ncbi:MAG: hypothetical protein IKA99_00025, partial [Clostridia bacterium]|nr:hypothetical protein [Clostridia bacterium]
ALRFTCGVAAGANISAILTGNSGLKRRPMRSLQEPLQKMGATVALQKGGLPPVYVNGAKLRPIDYPLHTASSQIKSSIMICALLSGVKATIKEEITTRNHMEILLKEMGARIERDEENHTICLEKSEIKGKRIFVCGDFSVAMNFIALGLLCGQTTCRNVGINPTRTYALEILKRMGAKIEIKNRRILCGEPIADITAYKSNLKATHVTGDEAYLITDELPILAVLMGVAEGESIMSDLGECQYKDADTTQNICDMINAVGGNCKRFDGGLVIKGVDRYEGGDVATCGDARIAMSATIALSASVNGGETDDDACVYSAFPGFFESLRRNSFVNISASVSNSVENFYHSFILDKMRVRNYTFSYLNVEESGCKKSLAEARDFDGFTVGSPFNAEVAKRLNKMDKRAKMVRGVNVVKKGEGFSTVGGGLILALKNRGIDIVGKKVLVLGCGTVAKSITLSLVEEKANVTVFNKNIKTANEFRRRIGGITILENIIGDEKYDVIINATPIGSGYLAGQTLVSDEMIKSSSLIVEMVSNPIDTALVKKARIEEISTICGDEVAFFTTYLADCILTEKEPLTEEALHVYSEFLKTRNGDVK